MADWRAVVEVETLAATPAWSEGGVPQCDDACPHHDGKRCELMGLRPGTICEPAVVEMAGLLDEHRLREEG